MRAPAALLALAAASACAPALPRQAADVRVLTSLPSPEVDALAERFFGPGGGIPTADLDPFIRDALARSPASGTAHEMAAYAAMLHSDDHAVWEEFLRAAADLANPEARVDLLELAHRNLTRGEMRTTVDVLAAIARESPRGEVRAAAHHARAGYLRSLGRADEARADTLALGFVERASLLGAFENEDGKGLLDVYPPESGVDLSAAVPGSVVPIRWRTVEAAATHGSFSLHDLVHPNQGAVAYLAFWVSVKDATAATLRLTTSTPVAAWVNRVGAVRDEKVQRFALDNVTGDAQLVAGWNEILVKSAVKAGGWSLGARVTDTTGAAIPGLLTAATPPAGFASTKSPSASGFPRLLAPKATTARAAFFGARRRVLLGYHAEGLAAFDAILATSKASPLLRYLTADAAERDRQVERALDLLTSEIAGGLPGFREARARLYREKELLSQAEHDLEVAIRTQPAARSARMELAEVLGHRAWHADRVAVLTDVTRRWPDSSWGFASLGAAYEAEGYSDKADEAYRTAIALDVTSLPALRARRRLLELRRSTGDVEEVVARIAAAFPGDVADTLAEAEIDRLLGHKSRALRALAAVTAESPDHPTPFLRRGQLAEESGDLRTAVAEYQAAAERDPHDAWLSQRLEHLRPPAEDALSPYSVTDEELERALHRPQVNDPAAHVQTLLSDTATLLQSDGSVRIRTTLVERALTQHGRDELVRIRTPMGGELRVVKAYAVAPDGKRQEASSIDRTSIRFRNLEIGSTVVLEHVFYPRRVGILAEDYSHDATFSLVGRHIERMRWVVVASKRKVPQVECDPRVTHTVKDAGEWTVHEFVREGAAALPSEAGMVPVADQQAHVVLSTVPSWDAFVRWEKAILDESFPADPAIDALAATLTAGATTPRDKLAKLFAYVAQEIRYQQEYESILAGWQPHRSSVVLERKYGDCKDKATLLIALARAVGIRVEFVTLATHGMGHPSRVLPMPRFNHAIAHVPVQPGFDEAFFLDATVDALDLWNLREDDQGASGLVLDPTTGAWSFVEIPFQMPWFQATNVKVEVDIESPEHVTAKAHMEARGTHASSLRKTLRSEDQARQAYDVFASELFPGATVVHAEAKDHETIVHPLTLDEELDVTRAVREEMGHFRLRLGNDGEGPVKLETRQTALDLGAPRDASSHVIVRLGSGVRLVDRPAPVEVTDPCFHAKRSVTVAGTTVKLESTFEQTCTTVSVADYPRFRAAMLRAHALLDGAIVFDRVKR